MNWAQFKDPVSHMCVAGAVGAFWSQVAGLSPFTVMTNIFVTEFSEDIWGGGGLNWACVCTG